jgi:molybdopterin-guanine dinucleotide biosynthesis protein A
MSFAPDLSAFILAGGKSKRMGADKSFVAVDGCTLLARMLELAHSVTDEVRIVGEATKYSQFAPVIQDIHRDCGPLGGIHAALRETQTELNLILAVDIPFVSTAFLSYLVQRARTETAAMVTAVRTGQRWQPLCAIYRLQFANLADKALREGRYKIDLLFDEARVQAITEGDLRSAGFSSSLFRNLNTPADLKQAQQEG